jgi:maltooligosyltrehalose trehalohydrolase
MAELLQPWGMELGAEIRRGGARFRVWAPRAKKVSAVIEGRPADIPLRREKDGFFSGTGPDVKPGNLYWYRLDKKGPFADPCSRYQPYGPHGPSMIVDPRAYEWGDSRWKGVRLKGQVVYELHVGAFTQEGTFDAAARELGRLKDLGVTLVEIMPVAEFPGRFNWGYDGVNLYAPSHTYGDPEALKRFVDEAHRIGMGVLLDVVYNHLGPDGNYLRNFSNDYFSRRHITEWGEAMNFDGSGSGPVRRFFVQNACYWISEFHVDGLRLDATQSMFDDSPRHVLADISRNARRAAGPRRIVMIAENEPQDVRALAPDDKSGFGLDALWIDDFHHTARVSLTKRREAYYMDYQGTPQELLSSVKRGSLYQGQNYEWQKKCRGTPVLEEPAASFIFFLQNHDQVANSVDGERLGALADPACLRALTALLLLAPETPLLFMGQESGAPAPFLFFADHNDKLAPLVHRGRKEFLAQFPSYATPESQARIPDPRDPLTFLQCKLIFSERELTSPAYLLHQDLLRLRRTDPAVAAQDRKRIDGAVLGADAFVLRFSVAGAEDRLLLVNLGRTLQYTPAPEPLLAPPAGAEWALLWSSNDLRYGGNGRLCPVKDGRWTIEGAGAVLLAPEARRD